MGRPRGYRPRSTGNFGHTPALSTIFGTRRPALTPAPPLSRRILYVRNLPFSISPEELYEVFGKYGAIRQVRLGSTKDTRGTAYVVYEDIFDAKNACEHLSGFNVQNRYLIVLYHQPKRQASRSVKDQEAEIKAMQAAHGVDGQQHPPPQR